MSRYCQRPLRRCPKKTFPLHQREHRDFSRKELHIPERLVTRAYLNFEAVMLIFRPGENPPSPEREREKKKTVALCYNPYANFFFYFYFFFLYFVLFIFYETEKRLSFMLLKNENL